MSRKHHYNIKLEWTGNKGRGTANYRAYDRSHSISIEHKVDILGSSDPAFRGDKTRHNPEELLVASLSACHMLWFLHLCADAGIIVTCYEDQASGVMAETADGGGHFTEATLRPTVTITEESRIDQANALHKLAIEKCFIARSFNFPAYHQPSCKVVGR